MNILVAGVDANVNADIDSVDCSNIDAGRAMKMTGSCVLARECNFICHFSRLFT